MFGKELRHRKSMEGINIKQLLQLLITYYRLFVKWILQEKQHNVHEYSWESTKNCALKKMEEQTVANAAFFAYHRAKTSMMNSYKLSPLTWMNRMGGEKHAND